MTNKEAIEFIKNMIDREAIGFVVPEGDGDVAIWQYHVEALELAITALENNSNDEVNNSTNNSTNEIENRVTGMTACRVPEVAKDTNVLNNDTISRQAAIDAIDEISCEVDDGDGFDYAKWREYFCELPPAEPERTCVNCGRTANNGGWYADGGTRCPIEEHYALPKDGYCHLWEKRNITDDDYPERREE